MNAPVVTPAQAMLDLTLWNAEAESIASSDLYVWLRESGLPSEAAIRLKSLVDITVDVGGRAISVGKIILMRIVDFVKAHPNLAIGIAIGAAIGVLVSMVPFLGVYLAPVAAAIGVTVGAIAGHRLDKANAGNGGSTPVTSISVSQDVIEIAKAFFGLLISILNAVFDKQVLMEK